MSGTDWDAGAYEHTSPDFEPAAEAAVGRVGPLDGRDVADLACGDGNAALRAAAQGARTTAVDSATRLLDLGRARAREQGLSIDFRDGDLQALPLEDSSQDAAVSVFGIIFAEDPPAALAEVARILRPGGRLALTAFEPRGPIHEMIETLGRTVAEIASMPFEQRFGWDDPGVLEPVAREAGLALRGTSAHALEIRADSPEAYVRQNVESHPTALAAMPVLEQSGRLDETVARGVAILTEGNEDPEAFLVHNPYVIQELVRR